MLFWLGIVVAFIPVAAVATAIVFYVLYYLSPEKKWGARVERCMAEAEKRLRAERKELKDTGVRLEKEERAIRRRAADTFLRSLSVAELEAYPGIGPGTVSKLQSAGFINLETLQDARIRVHGLGAKRLADIRDAVRALVKEARSRFEAGACREAQDLGPALEAVHANHAQREFLLRARLAGAEAVIAEMRPLLKQARKLTFFRYLRRESDPIVGEELLKTPLPDLERTIQGAENRAAAAYASRGKLSAIEGKPASLAAVAQPEPCPADWLSASGTKVAAAAPLASAEVLQQALRPAPSPTQPLDLLRLEATIEFAFAVARADGRIAHKEKEIIDRHIRNRFGDDLALLNRARAFCVHYESAAIDLTRCVHEIRKCFTAEEHRALFDFACEIADATGARNQRETEFLERISSQLGVSYAPQPSANSRKAAGIAPESTNRSPEEPASEPIAEQSQTTSSPAIREAKPVVLATTEERLALLEIDPAVPLSADVVRRQFNLLSQRYAPGKFETMGAEFVAVAENKRAALLAAASALLEQWGEKLETSAPPGQPQELSHNPDLDAMFGA